jgi:hypothetical protein
MHGRGRENHQANARRSKSFLRAFFQKALLASFYCAARRGGLGTDAKVTRG